MTPLSCSAKRIHDQPPLSIGFAPMFRIRIGRTQGLWRLRFIHHTHALRSHTSQPQAKCLLKTGCLELLRNRYDGKASAKDVLLPRR